MDRKNDNNSSKGISRRESLKILAKGAYAVPFTAVLLTAERAVAQSIPGVARIVTVTNNQAVAIAIQYTNGQGNVVNTNLAAGNSVPLTCAVGSSININGGAIVSPVVTDVPRQTFMVN